MKIGKENWLSSGITGIVAVALCGIAFRSWRGQLVSDYVVSVDYSNLIVTAQPGAKAALQIVTSNNIRVSHDYDLRLGTVTGYSRSLLERHDFSFHFPNKQSGGDPLWIRVRLEDRAVWVGRSRVDGGQFFTD